MATPAQRAANLIGALTDGTPTNAVVLKYAQAFWDVYGGEPGVSSPTNAQLASFLINRVRQHFKDVLSAKRATAVADSARTTELSAVATEINTELGTT